jgi:anti-sigma regulatory factor (Ser/Thr protein kinase)
MPVVDVTFSALPAHVRTARLVALAVARRAGVNDDLLDEVRLAVGEACSRAVGVNGDHSPGSAVRMTLSDEQAKFTVEVVDVGPLEAGAAEPDLDALSPEQLSAPDANGTDVVPDLPPGFGLAVISGLVEEFSVSSDGDGTHVRMSWPVTGGVGGTET